MGKKKEEFPYKKFGERLRETRLLIYAYKEMNKFAEATEIDEQMLYKYEQGRHFPSLDNFIKICKVLDKSPSYMLNPYLGLTQKDEEILRFCNTIRPMFEDEDTKRLLNLITTGFEIMELQRQRYGIRDLLTLLETMKKDLMK